MIRPTVHLYWTDLTPINKQGLNLSQLKLSKQLYLMRFPKPMLCRSLSRISRCFDSDPFIRRIVRLYPYFVLPLSRISVHIERGLTSTNLCCSMCNILAQKSQKYVLKRVISK